MSYQVHSIIEELPAYKGREQLIKRRQDSYDIIRQILKAHEQYAPHYDAIATRFWQGSPQRTAQHLFYFMKNNVGYVVEPTTFQSTKTPAAILVEGKEYGGDCKHYASFIVGVSEALRRMGHPIKAYYRFASYEDGKRSPGHVFAMVSGPDGVEYWTDPVLDRFDKRDPAPVYITDRKPPAMNRVGGIGELYTISGTVGCPHPAPGSHTLMTQPIPGGTEYAMVPKPHWLDTHFTRYTSGPAAQDFSHINGLQNNVMVGGLQNRVMVGALQNDVMLIGKTKKKLHIKIRPGQLLKKFGGAVPRNSMLGLIELNVFSLATKFNQGFANPGKKQKLQDWWKKLGGNPKSLLKSIARGVHTHDKLHKGHTKVNGPWNDEDQEMEMSGIMNTAMISGLSERDYLAMGYVPEEMVQTYSVGFAPVAIPAMLAAAAPLIASAKNILKSFGIDADKLHDSAQKADHDVMEKHNKGGDDDADTDDDGSVDHGGGIKTKVEKDAHGNQSMTMTMDKKDHDDGAGDDDTKDDGDSDGGDDKKVVKHTGPGGGLAATLGDSWAWIKDHKTYFFVGAGLIGVYILVKAIRNHKPKRGRR